MMASSRKFQRLHDQLGSDATPTSLTPIGTVAASVSFSPFHYSPILSHILSYTMLTINDRDYDVCAVTKQWCLAATSIPAAHVHYRGNEYDPYRPEKSYNPWRDWHNPSHSSFVSIWKLATRKYRFVSSFHNFPMDHIDDLVAPSTPLSPLSSSWHISALRALVNVSTRSGPEFGALGTVIIAHSDATRKAAPIMMGSNNNKKNELVEVSVMSDCEGDEAAHIEGITNVLHAAIMAAAGQAHARDGDSTRATIIPTTITTTMTTSTIFKWNNELPIACRVHHQLVFGVTCVRCATRTTPCCPIDNEYSRCNDGNGDGCGESPVRTCHNDIFLTASYSTQILIAREPPHNW
jgi:hypothetical protein